ncbi:hypothetical protein OF83DRAFT_328394 [Amylostereum chailletii]|nr:hypothetical protein OF83DRAFT_328394 [Amylostereum chailletii]
MSQANTHIPIHRSRHPPTTPKPLTVITPASLCAHVPRLTPSMILMTVPGPHELNVNNLGGHATSLPSSPTHSQVKPL